MKNLLIALIISLLLFSCNNQPDKSSNGKLNIVVSILPYADFVRTIAGNDVNVSVMIPVGANPETYEPTPKQIVALTNADIYIEVGGPFEFEKNWLQKIKLDYPNVKFYNPTKLVEPINENPHIWLGPENAQYIVSKTTELLISYFPENKTKYETNRDEFRSEIDKLVIEYLDKFNGQSNNTILTYHPAWVYLTTRFGLKEISIEHEGKEPNAKSLTNIIDEAKAKNIATIFVEPQFQKSVAETISNEIGAELVEINPLPENYLKNLKDVLDKIYISLK